MSNVSTYTILHIWEKAISVPGYDPDIWRKDFAGAWIRKDSYGMQTKYGWEVDHLRPLSKGGDNNEDNLIAYIGKIIEQREAIILSLTHLLHQTETGI